MWYLIYIFFGFVFVVVIINLVWRFSSRRATLPCPAWLGWLIELDNPFTRANRSGFIIEHLALAPGMYVLDIGCGPGRLTLPMAYKVGPTGMVTAMDIQSKMLERVRQKAFVAKFNNIQFLCAGIGDNKLERNRYDRALLITVLGEIPNREGALKEIFEVLKSGGLLAITESIFDPHFQSRKTVLKLAQDVGFRQNKIIGNRLAFTMLLEKP